MKKICASCLFALVAALFAAYGFERYINPETSYFLRAAEVSDSWASQMDKAYPGAPRYVFAGGSEVRSGICPELFLNEFGLVVVNSGGMAGYCLPALCSAATYYLRPGDTLLVSCVNYYGHCSIDAHGMKYAWFRIGNDIFTFGLCEPTLSHVISLLHGESGPLCMYVAKLLTRPHLLYKYDDETVIHPDGWMDIRYREIKQIQDDALPPNISSLADLAPETEAYIPFLKKLQQSCEKRKVKLVAFFPAHAEDESHRVVYARMALRFVQAGIPVLRDECLGCDADASHYADTFLHLTTEGVQIHNRLWAKAIKEQQYWTESELIAYLREHGWSADGKRMPH